MARRRTGGTDRRPVLARRVRLLVAATIVTTVVWIASAAFDVAVMSPLGKYGVAVYSGLMELMYSPTIGPADVLSSDWLYANWTPLTTFHWWFEWYSGRGRWSVRIPGWLLPALLLALAAWLHRKNRQQPPSNHCQACGYGRSNAASNRCPECGTLDRPQP